MLDDMVMAGNEKFHDSVLNGLKKAYPFKHWEKGEGMFLGIYLTQKLDGSICIDQSEYANKVKTIEISKERRKELDQSLTEKELQQFRGVLGAANWVVGSTRPDIAAHTALLQQRIGRATIADLIDANRLVSRMRDFGHTHVWTQSIPLEEAMTVATSDASWSNTESLGVKLDI